MLFPEFTKIQQDARRIHQRYMRMYVVTGIHQRYMQDTTKSAPRASTFGPPLALFASDQASDPMGSVRNFVINFLNLLKYD